MSEQITVNLTPRASQALTHAAIVTGDTKTDIINRALSVYDYFETVRVNGGAVFVRADAEGDIRQLIIF